MRWLDTKVRNRFFQALLHSVRTNTGESEVLDKGSIVIGVIKARGVINASRIAKESFVNEERAPLSPDYLDKNAFLKVVKVIESYVKIINKVTCQKWDYSS